MHGGTFPPLLEKKGLQRAVAQGFIDESQAMELAGIAEGGNLMRARADTRLGQAAATFAKWSSIMFQTSEKMNRRITFRAGLELARANPDAKYLAELREFRKEEYLDLVQKEGLSQAEATAFLAGKDAVLRTQFEYGVHARPEFMRGKKGIIFTFWMFTQNMMWAVFNSPGNKRMLLMMLLAGGLMGLPGADDLVQFAKFAARNLFGAEFDLEKELRDFIVSEFDPDGPTADLLLHGTGRFGFGLPALGDMTGIPIPSFDMSAAVGMGQVIPGVAALGPAGRDFEQRFSDATTDVAGASLGVAINMLRFMSDTQLPIDDAKRYERALPRSLRQAVRAGRFLSEGRERSRSGATVLDFDVTDPEQLMEVILSGAGFQPTRLAMRWDRIIAQRDAAEFWDGRRRALLAQWDYAVQSGDKEARSDVREAILRYNRTLPYKSLAITGEVIKRSQDSRKRTRERFEAGLPPTNTLVPVARDVQRLYPLDQKSAPSIK